MKVQTTILLLFFLSGVFLSSVVHAKPSPGLMKELIALEKYLEKKQGSDGGDGQNENQDKKPNGDNELESFLNNIEQNNGQMKPTNNGQDKPVNENDNNVGGEANNDGEKAPHENQKPDGSVPPEKPEEGVQPEKPEEGVSPEKPEEGVQPEKPEAGVPPEKPEEGVPPEKPEEGVPPEKPEEGVTPENTEEVSAPNGGGEVGEKPQESNVPNQSEGQVENGRDQTFRDLDQAIEKLKAALNILEPIGDKFRTQFENDDRKFNELQAKDKQTKEKTKEKIVQLTSIVEDIKDVAGVKSAEKKSVKENAPARRSHLSDTEFLNIVHSLLTDN